MAALPADRIAEPPKAPKRRLAFRVLRAVALTAVLAFLAHRVYLASTAISLSEFLARIDLALLIGALVLTVGALVVSGLLWHYLLHINGASLPVRRSLMIFAYAHFGRYIPGKIWMVVGRITLAARSGVRPEIAAQCAALEAILGVLSGLSLSLIVLPTVQGIGTAAWALVVLAIAAVLVFLHPKVFAALMNSGLRIFRRPPVDATYRFRQIALAMSLQILGWLTFGMGFFLLVRSIGPAPGFSPIAATGAFAGAWTVGYLSLLMPAGLGVREAVLVGLLELWLSVDVATVASLASRLLTTTADLLAIVLAVSAGLMTKGR